MTKITALKGYNFYEQYLTNLSRQGKRSETGDEELIR
jgi:hypothetical protein